MHFRSRIHGCAFLLAAPLAAQDLHLPLDQPDATWRDVRQVVDGVRGGAAHFAGGSIDAGPCPVDSAQPFTLRCQVRTQAAGFCTLLMARDGDAVGISLVLGREPGRIGFEAWSWRSVRLPSRSRIDDGRWHAIEVAYDPAATFALLFVDGQLEACGELGAGGAKAARLRLGNNIGADQPFSGDLDEVHLERRHARAAEFAPLVPVVPAVKQQAALAALRARHLRTSTPALAPTAAAGWPARAAAVRAHVADCLGLASPPPAVPLALAEHGELRAEGLRVVRVSWQSLPHHRATGWLWLPDPLPTVPAPAVLCPHGHWEHGARHPVVQARCAAFARFGWICLAVDSVHIEHTAAGVSSIGVMTWNNLRGLELLRARQDVDAAKIACTGASGGGQQTYYLMALADGLAAAAPICMACYFTAIVTDTEAHCGCNHPPRIAALTDVPEMCAVFAPRPVFFGSVTGDWTARFPEQGLPELRAHWERLGAGAAIQNRHAQEGHNYDRPMREAVYAFLHEVLFGPAPAARVAEPPFEPFALGRMQALDQALSGQRIDPDEFARESLARRAAAGDWRALAPGLTFGTGPNFLQWLGAEDAPWRAAAAEGPDGVPVPMLVGRSTAPAHEAWTVVVAERGKASLLVAPPPWLAQVPRPVLVDPRWLGEWQRYAAAWRRNGLILGQGEAYQAAHDLALVCTVLPGDAPVTLVGLGTAGVSALLAAELCPRIAHVVLDDLGPTYLAAGNRLPLAPEILRFGDLPELVQRIAARCQLTAGGCDGAPPLDAEAIAQAIARRPR